MQAPSLTPILRYDDPETAATWLCEVFDFKPDHVSKDTDGVIAYVALRCGKDFFLLCPTEGLSFDTLMVQPGEIGDRSTQCHYLTVEDVDAVCARAALAGAKIEIEPEDDGTGGRFCACRDPDGHLWSLGSRAYRATEPAPAPRPAPTPPRDYSLTRIAIAGLGVCAIAALALGYGDRLIEVMDADAKNRAAPTAFVQHTGAVPKPVMASRPTSNEARANREDGIETLRRKLTQALSEKKDTKRALEEAVDDLTKSRAKQSLSERELATSRQRVSSLERSLGETRTKLTEARGEVRKLEEHLQAMKLAGAQPPKVKYDPPEPAPESSAKTQSALKPDAETKLAKLSPAEKPASTPKKKPEPAKAVGNATKYKSRCAKEVYLRIFKSASSKSASWRSKVLNGLCNGALSSPEPARCFARIMHGQVSLGPGRGTSSAIRLCARSRSASRTLGCFRKEKSSAGVSAAISKCDAK